MKSAINARNLFDIQSNKRREAEADDMLEAIANVADDDGSLHLWTASKKDKAILRNVEVDEAGNIVNA